MVLRLSPDAWGVDVYTIWADHKTTGDSNWSWNWYERKSALFFSHVNESANWLYVDNRVKSYQWPVPGADLPFSFARMVESGE